MPEPARSLSLHAKIAEVQGELGTMPKDRNVEVKKNGVIQYTYDYLSESTLMRAVRERLSSRGVAVYVSTTKQWKEGNLTLVEVEMTFADGDSGDTFTVRGQGQGADTSDKGAYKAITGAVRYMLWKTFLVPTEGDDPNQPHEVNSTRSDAPVDIADAINRISRYVEDPAPWVKEALLAFEPYKIEAWPAGGYGKLPAPVRQNAFMRFQAVVHELESEPNYDEADIASVQALVRRAFAKAFDGLQVAGPDPFRLAIPF